MVPDRDLDDLLAKMASMILNLESRIADLERLESPKILETYTIANVSTDRSYDANSTSISELADVLGTLIADLQASGMIE